MIRNDNYNNKGEKVMSLKDKAVWLNGSDYIELDSVGSTLTSELKVIPITEYLHSVDENMAVHIYDLDDEWYNSLSSDDLTDFFEFIESTNHLIASAYNEWKTNIWSKWEEVNNCYMNLETI
jgi:hypothetical protein